MRSAPTLGFALAAVTFVGVTAAGEQPIRRDPGAALDPLVRGLVADAYCAGVVVALVSTLGPPQIFAWGETVRGNGRRPDGNTVFEIGSVTKVFTSLLLAKLAVDKRVSLETVVASLLPPGTQLPAGKRAITLLDLATHTSGLPRMPDNFHPADAGNPYADYSVDQLFAFLAAASLSREPGERFEYSNLGMGLLGQALARFESRDWATLVAEQITRPLGMTSTMGTLTNDARARFAQGYDIDGEPVPPWDLPTLAGAGALRSTAVDLAAFVKAELDASHDPKSPLAEAMVLSQRRYRTIVPEWVGKSGLGWHIRSDGLIWHDGRTGGYTSYVAFRPTRRMGVVVLINGGATVGNGLGDAALAAAWGEPVPLPFVEAPRDVILDEKILDSYVGQYDLPPNVAITISRVGKKLYIAASGQAHTVLHASSPRDFTVRDSPDTFTFELDSQGKVTGFVLHHPNGVDQRAPRK